MSGRSALWRQRDFLKLWTGQAISQIGSQITRAGLPLTAVLILDASPLQMGILNGASAAGALVFGLFAGAWVDRVGRRPLLIGADLLRAALLASIPLAAVLHRLSIGHLYLAASAAGVLTVLFDVAYQAYVPALINRGAILEANSKLALTESWAEVFGPGATGMLVQWLTAPVAIAFDALSFLISAVSVWLIRTPEPSPDCAPERRIIPEIRDGLDACWRDPILRALILRTATGAFFIGFQAGLYFLFAIRELGLNALTLGFVVAAGGAANLAGALFAPRVVRRLGVGGASIGAAILLGVASLFVPLAHGSVAACGMFLVAGQLGDAAWPVTNICDLSLRQAVTPPALLGRVNSAMHLMFHGVFPAGALAAGGIAGTIGIRGTMAISSAGFLLSTLFLVFSPVRRLRDLPVQTTGLPR